jgi:hypothetical protein
VLEGSWETLPQLALRHLGRVLTSDVEFEETKRRQIDAEIFAQFQ